MISVFLAWNGNLRLHLTSAIYLAEVLYESLRFCPPDLITDSRTRDLGTVLIMGPLNGG